MFALPRPTLRQVFALSLLGLLLSLSLLFYKIFSASMETISDSSARLREQASRYVVNRVTVYLEEAPQIVAHFEQQISHGLTDPANADSVRSSLLTQLLANENISEISFTFAKSTGLDPDGSILIDHSTAGEVTVLRSGNRFVSKHTWFDGKQFQCTTTEQEEGGHGESGAAVPTAPCEDPTNHLTFTTPIGWRWKDQLVWTDLHWSQLDESLPENQRHVEMSVQKSIEDSHGKFAGVLRVGLMKDQIDQSVKMDTSDSSDPSLIFLCDPQGRLITGFGGKDHITESGKDLQDLRMVSEHLPPQVAAALQQASFKSIDTGHTVTDTFRLGSEVYSYTFFAFPGNETQGWIVGIVVPRSYYLGKLQMIQRQVLWVSLALITAIIVVGGFILHAVGRALSLFVRETSRMNAFEFSASQNSSRLRDVGEVLSGLEKAKTAMRAMGKYVPVDLVRRLYRDGTEPILGGESVDLTVLFTDIRGFTSFAEQNDPDKVAEILGRYLQAMAAAIQGEKGTIDKFIGDSVMAFWNAPEQVPGHAIPACRAALKCRASLRALYDSPDWKETPAFETRYGLHRCVAYVGHFGAPDRFNYTAIGDGINLASRLEGLNKRYGTAIIASEDIYQAANELFEFRLLDRVAVKGKAKGITIYELLGERAGGSARSPVIENYEKAFAEFQRANFKAALAMLEKETQDPPSIALALQCRRFITDPPGEGWNGIHIFESK